MQCVCASCGSNLLVVSCGVVCPVLIGVCHGSKGVGEPLLLWIDWCVNVAIKETYLSRGDPK